MNLSLVTIIVCLALIVLSVYDLIIGKAAHDPENSLEKRRPLAERSVTTAAAGAGLLALLSYLKFLEGSRGMVIVFGILTLLWAVIAAIRIKLAANLRREIEKKPGEK